jgi:hypothetical protein
MPTGDVSLREFAAATVKHLKDNTGVFEEVVIMDGDPDDIQALSKGMGRKKRVARVSYDPIGAVSINPGLGRNDTYEFSLIVTCLQSTLGSASSRLGDGKTDDVTTLVKTAMKNLEGQNLGIFNSSGVQCGAARYLKSGDSLQAMQFPITGFSRESR